MLFIGKKGKQNVLFKDDRRINHRSNYLEMAHELASLIKKAIEENDFARYFLDDSKIKEQMHVPVHDGCGFKETDSDRNTEKRICRCMFYYRDSCEKCTICHLSQKYRNVSKRFSIVDAEVPTEFVIESCGGIDLIVRDEEDEQNYAVEVKPKYSKETLVRMIAEILTYTIGTNYRPAIAFFGKSRQDKDYNNLQENDDFKYILEQVDVFRIEEISEKDGIIDFEFIKLC